VNEVTIPLPPPENKEPQNGTPSFLAASLGQNSNLFPVPLCLNTKSVHISRRKLLGITIAKSAPHKMGFLKACHRFCTTREQKAAPAQSGFATVPSRFLHRGGRQLFCENVGRCRHAPVLSCGLGNLIPRYNNAQSNIKTLDTVKLCG
jgi:hypothetical protein